jgi:Ca-activated chloride channel family protein
MTLASPDFLLALIAVPLALLGYLLLDRRRRARAAGWSARAMEPNVVRRPPRSIRYVPAVLFLAALTFLLVGFARPERILGNAKTGGAVVTLMFDVSGSMNANDVKPSRIQAAHDLALRFLNELPSRYRVGIVTFADTARVVVSPTFDRKAAIAAIPDKVTPLAGTAIGDAIDDGLAATVQTVGKGLPGTRYPPGAIVLFSDGAQTDVGVNPGDAAQQALTEGIPLNAVAFGTPNGFVQQPVSTNGRVSKQTIAVPVDTYTLNQIAQQTNGAFFTGGPHTDLSKVYERLGQHTAHAHVNHDVSRVMAAAAFLFILGGIGLSGLWFGRIA